MSGVRADGSSVDGDTHLTVERGVAPLDDESTSVVLEVSLVRAGPVADSLSVGALNSGSISLSTVLSDGSHDVDVGELLVVLVSKGVSLPDVALEVASVSVELSSLLLAVESFLDNVAAGDLVSRPSEGDRVLGRGSTLKLGNNRTGNDSAASGHDRGSDLLRLRSLDLLVGVVKGNNSESDLLLAVSSEISESDDTAADS